MGAQHGILTEKTLLSPHKTSPGSRGDQTTLEEEQVGGMAAAFRNQGESELVFLGMREAGISARSRGGPGSENQSFFQEKGNRMPGQGGNRGMRSWHWGKELENRAPCPELMGGERSFPKQGQRPELHGSPDQDLLPLKGGNLKDFTTFLP